MGTDANSKSAASAALKATEATTGPATLLLEIGGSSVEGLSVQRARLNYGLEELRQGNYQKAESTLLKLQSTLDQSISGNSAPAKCSPELCLLLAASLTALGRVHMQLGKNRKALSSFQEAVTLFEDSLNLNEQLHPQHASDYGIALYMIGRHDEASAALKQALGSPSKAVETHLYLGAILHDRKQYFEAESYLQQAVEAAPSDVTAQTLLAQVLEAQGAARQREAATAYYGAAFNLGCANRLEDGLELLERSLRLGPDNTVVLATKAEMLRLLGQHEKALQTVEQALALGSSDVYEQLLVTKGGVLQALGHPRKALAELEKALTRNPENALALSIQGQALHVLGQNQRALEVLNQSIELEPIDGTYAELASVEYDLGQYKDALKTLDIALRLNPENGWALAIKADTLCALEKYEASLLVLTQALDVMPDNSYILTTRARVLRLLNRTEEALESADEALRFDDRNPTAWGEKGRLLLDQNRFAEAVVCLRRCLALDPDEGWAYLALGETLRLENQFTEALEAINQGLGLDPDNVAGLITKGLILHSLNMNEAAAKALGRAVERDSTLDTGFGELASVLLDLDRAQDALAAVNQALVLAADSSSLWLILKGRILNALGKYNEAITVLEQALKIEADSNPAIRQLAITYLGLNRRDEALAAFERALAADPKNAHLLASVAYTLLSDDKYDEQQLLKAHEHLDEALRIESSSGWAWGLKGANLCDLAEYDGAIAALNEAIRFDPKDIVNYILKGWAYQCLASQTMEESLERAIRNDLSLLQNALLNDYSGKTQVAAYLESAETAYKQGLELDAADLWCKKGLGNVSYLLGDKEAANRFYESVVEKVENVRDLGPGDLALIGWCKLRLGHAEEAVRLFIENQSIVAGRIGIQFDLALALLCNDQPSLSLEEYSRGFSRAAEKPRRRRHGLLSVARSDLLITAIAIPGKWSITEVGKALQILGESES